MEGSPDLIRIAKDLGQCAGSHEGVSCLLGNVTASQIFELCSDYLWLAKQHQKNATASTNKQMDEICRYFRQTKLDFHMGCMTVDLCECAGKLHH